jgi:hypothetical protein
VDGVGRAGIPGFLAQTASRKFFFRANSAGAERPWQTATRADAGGVEVPPGGVYLVTQEWAPGLTILMVADRDGEQLMRLTSPQPAAPLAVARRLEIDLGWPPVQPPAEPNPAELAGIGYVYTDLVVEWEVAP